MKKPTTGMKLGNRYRLVRQIAVGGMGEVWVAHDESLARDVAVKVLRPEFAGNAEFLSRLRVEARNVASLSHPGIAQLFDYGEQDGLGFLVMELVVGEPMSDLLERSPVLPLDRLLSILSQTARALHAAHVSGVVHRDVKPGNILLERSGNVKITDFGVSVAANQVPMTETGMVMGTAQYLSPEQAIGRAATPSSDIYAVGIIAFEATVGNRPYTGKTPVDIAVAHVNESVPSLPSSVPPALADLITRMLAKEPSDRPRSGAQLSRMLDQLAADLDRSPWLGRRSADDDSGPTGGGSGPVPLSRAGSEQMPRPRVASPAPLTPPAPVVAPAQLPPPMPTRRTPPSTRANPTLTGAAVGQGPAVGSRANGRRPTQSARRKRNGLGGWGWQSFALVGLILAIILASLIGALNADGKKDRKDAGSSQPGLSVVTLAEHREELANALRILGAQATPGGHLPSMEPTTLKDV